ncbi:hypothetical protein SAMN04244553_2148 [Nocardia amikacinitolerans]|uniref:Uncharacterized protein n=1 Tax=Nocardia amikacinitolerans TaxID=756689 RepID=A0A285L955_9NOCA|nr:hypothetical protein SAMN04244553_2148 [Nocardia amikacinitolerans]
MFRNRLVYSGHYLVNLAWSRVHCRVSIRGRSADLERADRALIAAGWERIRQLPDGDDLYQRDIRGSLSHWATENAARRVHTILIDAHSQARITAVSLERIRYQNLVFEHQTPPPNGHLEHGDRVDRLALATISSTGAQPAASVPGSLERLQESLSRNPRLVASALVSTLVGIVLALLYLPEPDAASDLPPSYVPPVSVGAIMVGAVLVLLSCHMAVDRIRLDKVSLVGDQRLPIWVLGQTPARLLIGDHEPSTEAKSAISNIRTVAGNSSYMIKHDNTACS